MWKKFFLRGSYKWIDILPDLIKSYNNHKHRSIGMKFKDVTADHTINILKKLNTNKLLIKAPKFKVGDKVRVSKLKNMFEKKYTPNWSCETFTIIDIKKSNPIMYYLKDYQDQHVAGGFYEKELHKIPTCI